jgi:hypothetical protein
MVKILSKYEQTNDIELKPCDRKLIANEDPSKEHRNKLIKEIVKKTLIELAVSLAFVGIACFFVVTPIGMATLFICAIAAVAINVILRSINSYCMHRIFQLNYSESAAAAVRKARYQTAVNFLSYLAPVSFSGLVDANTREVLMHEAGHALAANILIKKPQTQISIFPLQGGQTSYRLGALSKVGEFFGRANTKLIIAAAGPALSILTATVGLGASLALRNSNPELSRYLSTMSIDSIVQHVFYALSALWTSVAQKGHDFLQLMAGGIHPIIAAISMIALPIIVRIGFFIYDKIKEKIAEKQASVQKQFQHFKIQLPNSRPTNLAAA